MKIQGLDKHPEPATSQLLFSVFTSFALVPKSNLPILVYWRSLLEKNFIFQSHFVYVFRYSFRYFFVSSEISVCVKDHLFGKARNVYRNTKCISLVMLSGGDFFVFVIFVYRVEKEKKNNANNENFFTIACVLFHRQARYLPSSIVDIIEKSSVFTISS